MQTLISNKPNFRLITQSRTSNFLFSTTHKNQLFLNLCSRKCIYTFKTLTLCSATSSGSSSYGGWDDFLLSGDSAHSGASNQLHSFLNSLGIDDKKYVFVYLFGFVCALAISRIKVSSIVVFPACAIVFAVGFSIGLVNGGHMNELKLNGNKRKFKDEIVRSSIEKIRNLGDVFNGFDEKILNLKNNIRRSVECNQVTVSDLEGYVNAIESINLSFLNAREVFDDFIQNLFVDYTGKRELMDVEGNGQREENILAGSVKGSNLKSWLNGNRRNVNVGPSANPFNNTDRSQDSADSLANRTRRMKIVSENEKMNLAAIDGTAETVFNEKEYVYRNKMSRYLNDEQVYLKMDDIDEIEGRASRDSLYDSLDFSVRMKHVRTAASFGHEYKSRSMNENFLDSESREMSEREYQGSSFQEAKRSFTNHDNGSPPSSSILADDLEFSRYIREANILMKEAKECLRQKIIDDGRAENALYKSAKLLLKAIDMRPMSLLAVGQLGNSYLLHGELKLRISREFRSLLARNDSFSVKELGKVLDNFDDQLDYKDKLTSALVGACEECEELLIKAGRKYRLALSIDGNDLRALYNWGLALSFRAQLIADIGPGAAHDADKVFLAAIDKFDAMMSKSNVYAPDALFRWGAALQHRSRLRPRNSREKVKLLQQARCLYEDALHMGSENPQLQEALSSCMSELNYWYR
ncbi:Tetratricopeptide repeat-like superfamily, isoform 1 [Olea europaea subsp. europaea]|uniref:Tetratricopeptide repeat-like superfamily, isoform 1 n=1 Tax=Olea europaea subsp. europaea TaxID=158383 RepID=A0A8S0RX58_OLEEU|nr:Tetratricopeptide repeat-like superfamily, isoform 1 [Olea europaea subsp. europaea]